MNPPNKLSADTLALIYARLPEFKAWVKDIEDYVMSQALSGDVLQGYKLVEGRTQRKWTDPDAAARAMLLAGKKPDEVFVQAVIGITAAERLLGRTSPIFETHTERTQGRPTLVPESDPRPASGNTAARDFAE